MLQNSNWHPKCLGFVNLSLSVNCLRNSQMQFYSCVEAFCGMGRSHVIIMPQIIMRCFFSKQFSGCWSLPPQLVVFKSQWKASLSPFLVIKKVFYFQRVCPQLPWLTSSFTPHYLGSMTSLYRLFRRVYEMQPWDFCGIKWVRWQEMQQGWRHPIELNYSYNDKPREILTNTMQLREILICSSVKHF